ncbi:MAG: radical SAM protein [Oscillospiraceae bacterium]|nr:radical SAM protein [Oscillospiraceae bacterium]
MSDLDIKDYVFRKGAAKRIPVSGTFELTARCNLSCKMCYVNMSKDEQDKLGAELTAQEWIELGRQAVDAGMIYLLLTGGEPLLRPDFAQIYKSLIEMGLMITVNTNATLMTPQIIDLFRIHRPEKVNVTLYGMSDETYGGLCGYCAGFEKALRGIKMLKEAGVRVNLNTTFTRKNVGDLEKIVAFAKENQIPIRMTGFIFPPVRNQHPAEDVYLSPEEMGQRAAWFDRLTLTPERLAQRQEFIRKCLNDQSAELEAPECSISSCMAGRGAFWITWDGKMYPCGMLPQYEQNVRAKGFSPAWKDTCAAADTMLVCAECKVCKYQKICPSCAAVSMSLTGESNGLARELCRRTEAYAKAFLEEM